MKVWPIITLVGLLYGASVSDSRNVGRESNPHPARHRSTLDAEVAADFAQPHRPVTMAFREVFAKLLNEETDWSAPDGKKAIAVADGDGDDGEDPGKKLFWSTTHPDSVVVPFPGWGDPNPIVVPNPVVSPACSTCRPELFFTIIEDPAPSHENENAVAEAQSSFTMGDLPFGALKTLDNMIVATGGDGGLTVTIMPCETILVNGMCPAPCKDNDPLCVDDPLPLPLPIVVDPTDPTTPPIIIIGGGGSGPVGAVGAVPETSTWLMGLIGFGFLSLFRRSVIPAASSATPSSTKA